ncbi:MAG: YitT family protein [Lachnospiraceae bacterium]|nr:YitT family protein [Lachnospiraceae bacterium]
MNRLNMTDEMKRRLLMTFGGVVIAGFSVGMFQFSLLGMDPFQVFAHGIWTQLQHLISGSGLRLFQPFDAANQVIGYGPVYMCVNLVLLVLDYFLDRKKIGIATFINLFLVGYVVDFSYGIWARLIPHPSLPVRLLFLITAVVIMCFASALYFTSDLGVSTYDAIALALSEQRGWDFRAVRVICDFICTGLGLVMGVFPGIGTIVTAFFMGPLIEFFNVHAARPFRYGKK